MKKLTLMGAAVWLAVSAMAAVTPLARWSGDFNVATKGDFVLNAQGNTVADDGSMIVIAATATSGVTIDYPKEKGTVTVAVRYSGLTTPTADAALMTCYGASGTANANRSGVCLLKSSRKAGGVYTGAWYSKDPTVDIPTGSEGRFAYCYYPNSNDMPNRGGYFWAAALDGVWTQLAKWANIASADYNNITGCAIGGPRNQNLPASGAVVCLKGLVIEEIAVFQGLLTAAELDAAFPPSVKRQMPLPALKYAAEDAVTDGSGTVTSWPNAGTALSADLTAKGTGLTVGTGCFGAAPVVRFPGGKTNDGVFAYLQTAEASTFGLDNVRGATIFEVYTLSADLQKSKWGSWGFELEGGVRCWEDTANNGIHRWMWFSPGVPVLNSKIAVRSNAPLMITCSAARGGSSRMAMFDAGKYSGSGNHAGSVSAGKFALGSCCHAAGGGNLFGGDIAEFRLYNCELTAAEQFQVECELAEKYSMSVDPDGESPIASQLLKGHLQNPVVLGTMPAEVQGAGAAEGVVLKEGTSGDLTVGFAADPAAGAVTLAYVAGNGASAVSERTWAIAGAAGARAVPLSLTFTGADYVGSVPKSLFYRADAQSQWRRVLVAAEVTETSVSFVLPAGWENAQYGVFANVARETPALWFRAEDAVTDANGNVTSLPNVGTLAAEIPELKPTTHQDAGTIVRKTDAAWFGGRPYLHIVNSHLLSDGTTDLGLSDPVKGVAWFAVYRRLSGDGSKHGALFGMGSDDNSLRFCTFFGADQIGPYIRSSFLHSTACDVPLGDGSGLLSVSGFDRTANMRMNGATGRTTSNWWPATATPWAGKVYLGLDGLPWSATERGAFNGGIAEFRLYNHALTDVARAAIEVELASKYGLDTVETVGQSFDAAECAAHEKDALLLGRDPLGGPAAPVAMEWKDEVFHFAFGVEPAANERSLAFVGSDGAETSFVPRSAGSATEWIPRTWYVSSSAPSCGGVLEFSCNTSDADQFKYRLYRKGRTDSGYARLDLEPVIGDGKVTFALDDLSAGSYRFVRRLANAGMFIVIH